MQNKNITIFGDSLLRGVLLDGNGRYSYSRSIDWGYIESVLGIKITNKSKFGCDVTKAQKIVSDNLLAMPQIDVAVVEYGGNDSDFYWDEVALNPTYKHQPKTNLSVFAQKLDAIVKQLKNYGCDVVMMSLPPLVPDRYLKWISKGDDNREKAIMTFLGDVDIIYRRQEMFSNEIIKVAYKNNCQFVDVRQKLLQSDNFPDLMCQDGVHLNERGQQVVVDTFLQHFLDARLAIAN